MRRLFQLAVCVLTMLAFTGFAGAQSALSTSSSSGGGLGSGGGELKVGDPAPGFDVSQWYPDEVQKIEPGMCYVVDFYSLSNPLCKRSIPLLAATQQIFGRRGLKVIGITRDGDENVQRMIQTNRDTDFYSVGVDRDEKTTKAWQKAAKKEAIPTSFIVDRNGKIVWIGSPLDEFFYSIVQLTVLDRYDPKLLENVYGAFSGGRRSAKIKNFQEAYMLFDRGIKEDPRVLSTFAVEKLEIMLTQEKNYQRAYEYARELLKTYEGDAYTLSETAVLIGTDPRVENRDFELAFAMVNRAIELSKSTEPIYLSDKAAIHAIKGDFEEAMKLEITAFQLAVPLEKPYHKRKMEEYRRNASIKAKGGVVPPPTDTPRSRTAPGGAAAPEGAPMIPPPSGPGSVAAPK